MSAVKAIGNISEGAYCHVTTAVFTGVMVEVSGHKRYVTMEQRIDGICP